MTVGWNETMNALLDEFFLCSVREYERSNDDYMSDSEFEWSEVDSAVKKMRNGKVPGMDGVTAAMVKSAWIAVPVQLKSMYDACLKESVSEC